MNAARPKKKLPEIEVNKLREFLDYDPETGDFKWKTASGRKSAGSPAGNTAPNGYVRLGIKGEVYGAHRIAWAIFHGEWPRAHVDHINGNPSDNRIANLREASHRDNLCNRGKPSNNTSGHKGVSWHKHARKWVAHIKYIGPMKYLGCFEKLEDAAEAYENAAREIHKEFAQC